MRSPTHGRLLLPLLALVGAIVLGACSSSDASDEPAVAVPTAISGETGFAFPTGPASVTPVGYQAPGDHVPSTGAFLPANGKPTLVYVDAIW